MSEFRGVTPPNSVEAEQSVLGAMMQDENAVLQAAEALSTDDFYQRRTAKSSRRWLPCTISSAQLTS